MKKADITESEFYETCISQCRGLNLSHNQALIAIDLVKKLGIEFKPLPLIKKKEED
jgi:hypothetical protein